jgi:acetyl esterase/lipase
MNYHRRQCAQLLVAGLAYAGQPLTLFAATSDGEDYLRYVDPELRAAAREVMRTPSPPDSPEMLAAQRKAMAASAQPAVLPQIPIQQKSIAVPGGPEVVIYVVNARAGASRPGILYMHGGGYIRGSAASTLRAVQEVASALDCAMVSVEYRLAPETRFAGSIEDNYAGLKWLHAHATELGVDPSRLGVMGGSAGGGHAALLAITARDRGAVPLRFQTLLYPMLDDRTGSTRKPAPHTGRLVWTAASNHFGWQCFLGAAPGGPNVPAQAVPARTHDLKGLPPAFIGVGTIDLFIDEDIDYAKRLIDVGVPATLLVVPGAFHGFDSRAHDTSVAKGFTAAMIDATRRGLA